MLKREVTLIVTPGVKKLGINVDMAMFIGANIANKSLPLEKHKKRVIEKIRNVDFHDSPILREYRELYDMVGLKGQYPPAQHLLRLIQKHGRIPNINTVVDSYNIVSAETFLSVGAHDLAHIKGPITFGVTDGTEKYTPLGENKPEHVKNGEYACMDEEKILCRMDIKQCDETKITKQTKSFMVYVQGNKAVDQAYLEETLSKVCKNIERFCMGKYHGIEESNH